MSDDAILKTECLAGWSYWGIADRTDGVLTADELVVVAQNEKERADSEAELAELEARPAEEVTRQRDEARKQAE